MLNPTVPQVLQFHRFNCCYRRWWNRRNSTISRWRQDKFRNAVWRSVCCLYRSVGWWCMWHFESKRRQMADRRMFPHHENWLFCKTSLSAQWKPNKSTFSHLLPFTSSVQTAWKKTGIQVHMWNLTKYIKRNKFCRNTGTRIYAIIQAWKITDDLHDACGFRTDYQFITKSQMKTIQKKSKCKE